MSGKNFCINTIFYYFLRPKLKLLLKNIKSSLLLFTLALAIIGLIYFTYFRETLAVKNAGIEIFVIQLNFILLGIIFFIRRLKLNRAAITFKISGGMNLTGCLINFILENICFNMIFFIIAVLLFLPHYILQTTGFYEIFFDFLAFYIIFLNSYLLSIIICIYKENKTILLILSVFYYCIFLGINIYIKCFDLFEPLSFLLVNILSLVITILFFLPIKSEYIQNYFIAEKSTKTAFVYFIKKIGVRVKVYLQTYILKLASTLPIIMALLAATAWICALFFFKEWQDEMTYILFSFLFSYLFGFIFLENFKDFNFKFYKSTSISFVNLTKLLLFPHFIIILIINSIFCILGIIMGVKIYIFLFYFFNSLFTSALSWVLSFSFIYGNIFSGFCYTIFCLLCFILIFVLPILYFIFAMILLISFYYKARFNFENYTFD